ncbi:ABC transporter permease [Pseudacidovorax intermedius]|uniref:Mannopine transport system permease protein n=1 Tax=Pseudacidovorax intermedius TaxID=433924 RepID=A0A370FBL3_9BURK|nr:ABC transporter permease [Pseudacidovorax intermedius]RDI22631.1 mannopine transport system permease protein [Pseudacidovorax intermedius]
MTDTPSALPAPRNKARFDLGSLSLRVYVWLVVLFIMLPTLIIVPMSFSPADYLEFPPRGFTLHWYEEFFADPQWQRATLLSLRVAALTMVCSVVIGTMVAYAIVRGAARLRPATQLMVIGPVIAPHIAVAVACYLFYQRLGVVGTMTGFVAAHTVLALPFVVFTVSAALSRVDPDLESAAMSCGASRLRAFFLVTLPLIVPGLLSGALFAFIISFDEPVVSFFVSSVRQRTLPRRMFEDIEQNLTPVIPAIATLLTLLSIAVLVAAALLRVMEARRRSR